jgi:hypothetical protein
MTDDSTEYEPSIKAGVHYQRGIMPTLAVDLFDHTAENGTRVAVVRWRTTGFSVQSEDPAALAAIADAFALAAGRLAAKYRDDERASGRRRAAGHTFEAWQGDPDVCGYRLRSGNICSAPPSLHTTTTEQENPDA